MSFARALVARVCHDLITPFNAINLGIEAFEMSNDSSLLEDIKRSINKANVILKFMRELYSVKSDAFCYSVTALKQLIADFLKESRISFEFESSIDNIPDVFGKIILHNAIIVNEIMPFGGTVLEKVNAKEIIITCIGQNISIPDFCTNNQVDHKNVIRASLLKLLNESGFKISVCQEKSNVIFHESCTL